MKPFHQPKVLSVNKEGTIQRAYTKALSHPGVPAWVAEHGGNPSLGFGGLAMNHFKKQIIFAAALIEDGEVCRWHYLGWTNSNPTEIGDITMNAGFSALGYYNSYVDRRAQDLKDLKDLLIVNSGKFLERMPLYINHNRKDIRELARKVLRGK